MAESLLASGLLSLLCLGILWKHGLEYERPLKLGLKNM